jgi:lysophospholipase L1-like esterase
MRLHRWLVAGLALSVAANVAVAVVYLMRPPPAARPDVYRMDRIDQFRRLTTTEPDLVMLGDSLTDRGEWHELLGARVVANRGIAGETLSGVMARLDTVVALKPKSVAIMLGINDLLAGEPVDTCLTRYTAIIDALQRLQPAPRIVVQSVLPVGRNVAASNEAIRLLNTQLSSLCIARNCEFLDLFPAFVAGDGFINSELTTDGVHLNGRGYVLWASRLK